MLRRPSPRLRDDMPTSPLAGQPAASQTLIDVAKLVTAYYSDRPDPTVREQRVAFGTSGHRGSAFTRTFNEAHILAITQAICSYRKRQRTDGPLFLGKDTHALSEPAFASALEVLAANDVEVMIDSRDGYTPTPAISHAILTYNHGRTAGLADGIVITPSHNPPEDGGFKYNPPHGGPADTHITRWIENQANEHLEGRLSGVKRVVLDDARHAPTTHAYDFCTSYVADLDHVLDMEAIRRARIRLAVDPMGGAGVHYWPAIAERYGLDLTIVNGAVDPTFRFMTLDWDGRIRMDPSSPYVMKGLLALRDQFDIAFACDTDHDRHGVITRGAGLLSPNHYLSVCIAYLFANRPQWRTDASVGKTVVSSNLIDYAAARVGRSLFEVPVGFKWFVAGLLTGSLGFAGEESAGSSFLRLNGQAWSTDKDGIAATLLAAEIAARTNRDPGEVSQELVHAAGDPLYERIDAPATPEEKSLLGALTPKDVTSSRLAGEDISRVLTTAPGNDSPIGGVKVSTSSAWFAARPSGTEDIYKIYTESVRGEEHLRRVQRDAQDIVGGIFAATRSRRSATPPEDPHSTVRNV
jgi:phosphoglucomutase